MSHLPNTLPKMHQSCQLYHLPGQLLFVQLNQLHFQLPTYVHRHQQNLRVMHIPLPHMCRLNHQMSLLRTGSLFLQLNQQMRHRLRVRLVLRIFEPNLHFMYKPLQNMHQHYQHMPELLNWDLVQLPVHNRMS